MNTAYDLGAGSTDKVPKFVMTLFTVDEFFGFWPRLEEMLDRVPHTWRYWTKEYICQSVAAGLMQVWGIGVAPRATYIVMTTVNVYPAMRVLAITWAAGKFEDDMMPLLDATFTNYAKLNDCGEIEIRGRLGWHPKLKAIGFEKESNVWTRRVVSAKLN